MKNHTMNAEPLQKRRPNAGDSLNNCIPSQVKEDPEERENYEQQNRALDALRDGVGEYEVQSHQPREVHGGRVGPENADQL